MVTTFNTSTTSLQNPLTTLTRYLIQSLAFAYLLKVSFFSLTLSTILFGYATRTSVLQRVALRAKRLAVSPADGLSAMHALDVLARSPS